MNKPYQPIACAIHDEYEIAIMQKKRLLLKWHDEDGGCFEEVVFPVDIQVKDREEFLITNNSDGKVLSIRLDRIDRMRVY